MTLNDTRRIGNSGKSGRNGRNQKIKPICKPEIANICEIPVLA